MSHAEPLVDLVTVFHCTRNWEEHLLLRAQLEDEPVAHNLIAVDNTIDNRGFGRACNYGASLGDAPVIGFLNPDALIEGPFLQAVVECLAEPLVAITGCRFGKPDRELRVWGVREWVCGAAMFVRRGFFDNNGGFDEQFVWGWEETDLIRRAEQQGWRTQPLDLPIRHSSPTVDTPTDAAYKNRWFDHGARRYTRKWRRGR